MSKEELIIHGHKLYKEMSKLDKIADETGNITEDMVRRQSELVDEIKKLNDFIKERNLRILGVSEAISVIDDLVKKDIIKEGMSEQEIKEILKYYLYRDDEPSFLPD
jgi:hypothetical protein